MSNDPGVFAVYDGGGFPIRFHLSQKVGPLIIDLHQWSGDQTGSFGNDTRLDESVADAGWNYARPFIARNNQPDGCCSEQVVDRINATIQFMIENGQIDRDSIHIVGASGGGYAGLCALMSDKIEGVATYNLWVPITDLSAWYWQTRGTRYATDILRCTASGDILDVGEAHARSPLYMSPPQSLPDLSLYAGINDGWRGSVPVTHSIRMFNMLAKSNGNGSEVVSDTKILELLELRQSADENDLSWDDDLEIVFRRKAGNVDLILFQGAHEGLTAQVMRDIASTLRAPSP